MFNNQMVYYWDQKKPQWCPENDQVSAMGSTTTPLPVKLKLAMPGNRNAQRNPSLWAMPWPCHGHGPWLDEVFADQASVLEDHPSPEP